MLQNPNNNWIIIPFSHRQDLLFPLLDSLVGFSILVVDDSNGIGFLNIPNNVWIIKNKKLKGFGSAVNFGLEYLFKKGVKYALILNDDVEITTKSVQTIFNSREEKTILAPIIQQNQEKIYGARIYKWGRVQLLFQPKEPTALLGTCLLLPTELRFDPRFPHGFEDFELCLRAKKEGYQLKRVEEALCKHIGEGSLSRREAKGQRYATYGQLLLFSKYHFPIVASLSLVQILKERGKKERYLGWSQGVGDWVLAEIRSFAARIPSSKAGSNKAK